MKPTSILVFIYAILVLVGGLIGFAKAQSIASLMAGVIFGVGLFASGLGMLKNKSTGLSSSIALTVILGSFFIYRFSLSHQFMPAGLMCIISIIVLFSLIGCRYFTRHLAKL